MASSSIGFVYTIETKELRAIIDAPSDISLLDPAWLQMTPGPCGLLLVDRSALDDLAAGNPLYAYRNANNVIIVTSTRPQGQSRKLNISQAEFLHEIAADLMLGPLP